MADNFGLKMGIEGEKQFKSALRDINSSFKVLGSEMKLVSSQFDKNDKSQEAVTARSKVLNKEIEEQKKKIELLQAALKNSTESFGENDKRTQNWAIQLNNAKADLNKLNKELDENEDALEDDGKEFKDAEKKADNFGDELKDTAGDAEKASDKLKKVGSVVKGIGKAMGAAIGALGTATVAVGKKLTEMAAETANAGDEVDKMSQKLGMSYEGYQKWDYVLGQAGVDITSMTTGMKTLTNKIDDAKNGSDKAQAMFTKLGISMSDLQTMSREDIFAATIKGFQGMSDSTERAALANDLFGKSGQNLTPLFNESTEKTEELMQAAEDLGFVMSDKTVKASAEFNDSLDTLKRTFSGVKNNIMGELLPGFSQIMYGLSDLLAGNEEAKEKIQTGAQELVSSLGDIFPKVVDILLTLIGAVAEIAPVLIDSLVTGIADNLPSIVSAASNIAISFLSSLTSALPQITDGALQLVLTLANGILSNLPSITETAIQTVVTLALGIASALPDLIPTIVDCVVLICQILIDNLDLILDAGFQLLEGVISGILSALPKLVAALPRLIESIVTFISNNLPKILSMGVKLTIQVAQGLIQALPQITAQIPKILNAILKGLSGGIGSMGNVGHNLLVGLWNGIANIKDWLISKIRGLGSAVTDALKAVFGIASPSKVFKKEIGENLALGLGEGFEDEMKQVSRDMQKAVPTSFDIQANLNGAKQVATDTIRTPNANGGLTLNLNIDKFLNQGTQDIHALAEEISVAIATSVRRKGVAF